MNKITKQDLEDAVEMFEDLPQGAQFQAIADHLCLENSSEVLELLISRDCDF